MLCRHFFSVNIFGCIIMQNTVILFFTEWYRVWVFHLSLVTVFIQSHQYSTFSSLNENHDLRKLLFVFHIPQTREKDPLFTYYLKFKIIFKNKHYFPKCTLTTLSKILNNGFLKNLQVLFFYVNFLKSAFFWRRPKYLKNK